MKQMIMKNQDSNLSHLQSTRVLSHEEYFLSMSSLIYECFRKMAFLKKKVCLGQKSHSPAEVSEIKPVSALIIILQNHIKKSFHMDLSLSH